MKKIKKIFLILVITIIVIAIAVLNSPSLQDKVLNIGLNNIANNTTPFLDEEDSLKVVVCGSRSPLPSPGRAEACILVEAGDDIYIFDVGNGSVNNLQQYQVQWPNVKGVFITHMHSDHMADLPDAHLASWIQG